jgi:2'-5' RNA ligase
MSSRTETTRLFFALVPDWRIRRAVSRVQRQLDLPGKMVAEENLHITLGFLGEVPWRRLPELERIAAAVTLTATVLELDEVGCFAQARVAWLGPSQPSEGLQATQRDLNEQLASSGFRAERRKWQPHVTLYRDLRKACGKIPVEPVFWPLDGISLVQSELLKGGPRYQVLKHWPATG